MKNIALLSKKGVSGVVIGIIAFHLLACHRESTVVDNDLSAIPSHFPKMEFPEGNAFTVARYDLGKKLFFDPRLSVDSSISCSSCHKADFAMADNVSISPGVAERLGVRNAPTLINVGYLPYFMSEGGVPTLEMQVLAPIQEHVEMDFNIVLIAERMKKDSVYVRMSNDAYQRDPDPYVISRALANYERTFVSGNSAFDHFQYHGINSAMSLSAQRGMNLFYSERTNCSVCHAGLLFSSFAFENNGLDSVYADIGRMRHTYDTADEALFKIPMLRNVEYTAPYMHNGSISTLEEVVEHYNSGGANHRHKSGLVKPLNLTEEEKVNLVAFLKALSDPKVLTDERYRE